MIDTHNNIDGVGCLVSWSVLPVIIMCWGTFPDLLYHFCRVLISPCGSSARIKLEAGLYLYCNSKITLEKGEWKGRVEKGEWKKRMKGECKRSEKWEVNGEVNGEGRVKKKIGKYTRDVSARQHSSTFSAARPTNPRLRSSCFTLSSFQARNFSGDLFIFLRQLLERVCVLCW